MLMLAVTSTAELLLSQDGVQAMCELDGQFRYMECDPLRDNVIVPELTDTQFGTFSHSWCAAAGAAGSRSVLAARVVASASSRRPGAMWTRGMQSSPPQYSLVDYLSPPRALPSNPAAAMVPEPEGLIRRSARAGAGALLPSDPVSAEERCPTPVVTPHCRV